MSRLGVIKATYQIENILKKMPVGQSLFDEDEVLDSTFSSNPVYSPTPTQIPPSRYVLLEKNEKVTFLITPQTIPLYKFVNLNVLVT
ncbi:MAG: hypothetical protein V1697_03505 [Candidatus Levyibacteriota bacterium]